MNEVTPELKICLSRIYLETLDLYSEPWPCVYRILQHENTRKQKQHTEWIQK
jgi:hypothetical protein